MLGISRKTVFSMSYEPCDQHIYVMIIEWDSTDFCQTEGLQYKDFHCKLQCQMTGLQAHTLLSILL